VTLKNHSKWFKETFKANLKDFMDPVNGFDVVKFDTDVLKNDSNEFLKGMDNLTLAEQARLRLLIYG
jgi:hypothetical protein